jgi:hypothetical protein
LPRAFKDREKDTADFQSKTKSRAQRATDINWDQLSLKTHELHALEVPFTEEEIKMAIQQMPS